MRCGMYCLTVWKNFGSILEEFSSTLDGGGYDGRGGNTKGE